MYCVKNSIIAAANPEAGDVEKLEIPASASLLESVRSIIDSSFGVYLFIIIIRTRSFIRRQSSIPEKNCGACEDFCCACCDNRIFDRVEDSLCNKNENEKTDNSAKCAPITFSVWSRTPV